MRERVFLSYLVLGFMLNVEALAQGSPDIPEIEYCVSQQIAGGVEPFTEDRLLVGEAVNAYLRRARLTPEEAEAICRHSDDSMRIYLAYTKAQDVRRVSLLASDASIQVAGTMVQLQGCWLLLMDSGARFRLEPLPRVFMRIGQRVELMLSGHIDHGGLDDSCPYPAYPYSDPRLSDWGHEPTELVASFERDVRRVLAELGFEATVAIDATGILLSGMNGNQVLLLEEALRGSFGMFMLTQDQGEIYFWPNARSALN